MTALEELRSGDLGAEFVRSLYRTVAVVARARNFPAPSGHASWTRDAVIETAHDFMVSHRAQERLVELAAASADDEAFERLLSATVLNHLRGAGRRTTVGKLIRRLRGLIADDQRFVTVAQGHPGADNVALAGVADPQPYGESADVLRQAARRVTDVRLVKWSPNARREGPVADGPSLLRVCEAVLSAAGGSLRLPDLAEVVALRFGLDPHGLPTTVLVDDIDVLDRPRTHDDTVPGSFVSDDAEAMLVQFSARETLVLAWLHETVRVIADRTGLPASSAGALKQRVAAKLRVLLKDEDDERAETLALEVRDSARTRLGLETV